MVPPVGGPRRLGSRQTVWRSGNCFGVARPGHRGSSRTARASARSHPPQRAGHVFGLQHQLAEEHLAYATSPNSAMRTCTLPSKEWPDLSLEGAQNLTCESPVGELTHELDRRNQDAETRTPIVLLAAVPDRDQCLEQPPGGLRTVQYENAKPLKNVGVVGSAERGSRCRYGAPGGAKVRADAA
jgi:hypothetical protein